MDWYVTVPQNVSYYAISCYMLSANSLVLASLLY